MLNHLNVDGIVAENSKEIAKAFNCYFCSVGENLSLAIVEHYDFRQYLPNVNYNLYENFDLATPVELMEILRQFLMQTLRAMMVFQQEYLLDILMC